MPLEQADKDWIKATFGTALGAALKHDDFLAAVKTAVEAVNKDAPAPLSRDDIAAMIAQAVEAAPEAGDDKNKGDGGDGQTAGALTPELVAEQIEAALKAQADDAARASADEAQRRRDTAAWLAARGLDKKVLGTPIERRFDGCQDDDERAAALETINAELSAIKAPTLTAAGKGAPASPFSAPAPADDPRTQSGYDQIHGGLDELLVNVGAADKDSGKVRDPAAA